MPSRDVTIAVVQMSCAEEPAENLDKAVSKIAEAAKAGAQIVCLQELFGSRYFCQVNDRKFFSLAEAVPGPSTEILSKAAKENKVVVVGSLFEKDGANYYNTACVLDADGRYLGKYRKVHIPDDLPNHYSELFYFKHGDLGYPVFQTQFAKIGVQVCWDQWFPEGARSLALQGAEIIFYPTAIGWPNKQREEETGRAEFDAWVTVQRGHAIANTTFVAVANRTGLEDHLQFWGGSFIADPLGRVLKNASHDQEETMIATLPLGRIDEVRKDWPFLTCRRPDAYRLRRE
ncbi:MAG TPA: carbon-nitrogen hydrolase [bacterium]|nr:carbon-nitrogen hydrolase [bacterium]